jgi:hypothetical protein
MNLIRVLTLVSSMTVGNSLCYSKIKKFSIDFCLVFPILRSVLEFIAVSIECCSFESRKTMIQDGLRIASRVLQKIPAF